MQKKLESVKTMSRLFRPLSLSLVFLLVVAAFAAAAAEPPKVVARGDGGLVVTDADMGAMRQASPNFVPTDAALLQATVRVVLFSRAATEGKINCPGLKLVAGFDRHIVLSYCYERELLRRVTPRQDAVESWYRAHWQRFKDDDGKLKPLSDDLRPRIRAMIIAAKSKSIVKKEYERLCDHYHIKFVEPRG